MIDMRSYREILREEINKRSTATRRYSLRAMAKKLGISASLLSAVIRGKRDFSLDTAEEVVKALKLPKETKKAFLSAYRFETTNSDELREDLREDIEFTALHAKPSCFQESDFHILRHWFNPALLELASIPKARLNIPKLAKLFDEPEPIIAAAVSELIRVGQIFIDRDNLIRKRPARWVASSEKTNTYIREFHRTMLRRASVALDKQTNAEKFVGSETFAFNVDDLAKANTIIEECFTDLIRLSAKSKNKNAVYHAQINFFRVTRMELE